MRLASWFVVLGLSALACTAADDKADKGTVVTLDGMKSRTPATWKAEKPTNKLRLMQFRLPRVEGDKYDAELVIFHGISGGAKANLQRWKDMFLPPPGKKIDDVATVKEMKVGDDDATFLDLHGTYKYKERPFDPRSPQERRPDYRLLGLQIDGKDNHYHIRLVGPAKTVAHYKKGFDDWLKGFKK